MENRDVLFGAFSSTITKESKRLCWIGIRDYAVAIGLVTNDKDFAYIRDSTWPNLRSRTVVSTELHLILVTSWVSRGKNETVVILTKLHINNS